MSDLEFIRQLCDPTATTIEARTMTPDQRTFRRSRSKTRERVRTTAHEKPRQSLPTAGAAPDVNPPITPG